MGTYGTWQSKQVPGLTAATRLLYLRASESRLLLSKAETARLMSEQMCSACGDENLDVKAGAGLVREVRVGSRSTDVTHLHGVTVEEEDLWLLLLRTLTDQHEQGGEEFLCVDAFAAVDGLQGVLLQLVLRENTTGTSL